MAKKKRKFDKMLCGIRVSQEMYNDILILKINPTEVMRKALKEEIRKKSLGKKKDFVFYE
jgi:hypothetical protein